MYQTKMRILLLDEAFMAKWTTLVRRGCKTKDVLEECNISYFIHRNLLWELMNIPHSPCRTHIKTGDV